MMISAKKILPGINQKFEHDKRKNLHKIWLKGYKFINFAYAYAVKILQSCGHISQKLFEISQFNKGFWLRYILVKNRCRIVKIYANTKFFLSLKSGLHFWTVLPKKWLHVQAFYFKWLWTNITNSIKIGQLIWVFIKIISLIDSMKPIQAFKWFLFSL